VRDAETKTETERMEVILRTDGDTRSLCMQKAAPPSSPAEPEAVAEDPSLDCDSMTNQTERSSCADDDGRTYRFEDNDSEEFGGALSAELAQQKHAAGCGSLVVSEEDGGHWLYVRSNHFPPVSVCACA